MSFKVTKLFFDRKGIQKKVASGVRKILSRFGAFVRQRAKSSMKKSKKISAPGSTPHSHTGLLRKFIFFSYDPSRQNVTIGPVRFAGTRVDIPGLLEHGGMAPVRGRKKGGKKKVGRYRPRPYMRPAFDAELKELPPKWKDSIK